MDHDLKNCIIYLIGYPGTGKYTVAKEIAKHASFKLVDNHLINQPVFSLIRQDGKTPLPPSVWINCKSIWRIVFDTMLNIAPPENNYVLTNYLCSDESDSTWYIEVEKMAADKSALFVPVLLTCAPEEMTRRVVAPERKEQLKLTCPERLLHYVKLKPLLKISHPNLLTLDITDISPENASQAILDHARSLK